MSVLTQLAPMKRRPATPKRAAPERELRRQQIIDAAVRLFAERGMENVTFGDIAKAAKLSRPLVYFYFPDLQSLFFETLIVASNDLQRRFQAAARPSLSGLDQLMAVGRAYVEFAQESPALFHCLAHNESKQSAEHFEHPLHEQCACAFDGIMGVLVAALHKGMRDGTVRADIGDPGKVAICLWGLTHGLIQLNVTKQPIIGEKLGSPFADLPDFGLDMIRRSLAAAKKSR